jgi:hypothetical protein
MLNNSLWWVLDTRDFRAVWSSLTEVVGIDTARPSNDVMYNENEKTVS